MIDKKYLRNDDFLCTVENTAKRCLLNSHTDKDGKETPATLDPSIALILVEEIRRLRTMEQLLGAGADYTQGYEDGWRDGRCAVSDDLPLAWAIIGRKKANIRLLSEKPNGISADETVVALYAKPH
jgi:hypothetical protein